MGPLSRCPGNVALLDERIAELFARVGRVTAELFFDAQQLIVFCQTLRAARRARFDL